jgi:hypothetical protein
VSGRRSALCGSSCSCSQGLWPRARGDGSHQHPTHPRRTQKQSPTSLQDQPIRRVHRIGARPRVRHTPRPAAGQRFAAGASGVPLPQGRHPGQASRGARAAQCRDRSACRRRRQHDDFPRRPRGRSVRGPSSAWTPNGSVSPPRNTSPRTGSGGGTWIGRPSCGASRRCHGHVSTTRSPEAGHRRARRTYRSELRCSHT